jgi:Na+/melibiose symporter-like transporter
MATGSGKTKVMALAIAWQYFNAVAEARDDYARTFMVIAPNVIVFDLLFTDFYGGRIFKVDPIIPPELKILWDFDCYMRGEAEKANSQGALCLTNVQQFYERNNNVLTEEPENRVFSISVITTFLTSLGMFGAILYVTVFAQDIIGESATNSGLVLMPMMLGLIVASILSGLIISRTGKYRLLTIIGMVITVFGMFLFSGLDIGTTQMALTLRMVLLGFGLGITQPVFTIVVQSAFDDNRLGEVTAGIALFRGMGGTVGTAVLGGIMNSQLASHLVNIQNEPFVAAIKRVNLNTAIAKIDANAVQGLLSPGRTSTGKGDDRPSPSDYPRTACFQFWSFSERHKNSL